MHDNSQSTKITSSKQAKLFLFQRTLSTWTKWHRTRQHSNNYEPKT